MIYLYALIPALTLGGINAWYWHRRGYTAVTQMILGLIIFYAGSYKVLEFFLSK